MLKTKKISNLILAYLCALDKCQLIIFSAYIKRDYLENALDYEKSLLQQVQKLFKILEKIRLQSKSNPECDEVISRLEHLYEIIFSIDLLKNRLIDHATFEIAENELKQLSLCLSNRLTSTEKENANRELESAILAIETLFQMTLQFVTADPFMLLFFIRDIRSFYKELKKL